VHDVAVLDDVGQPNRKEYYSNVCAMYAQLPKPALSKQLVMGSQGKSQSLWSRAAGISAVFVRRDENGRYSTSPSPRRRIIISGNRRLDRWVAKLMRLILETCDCSLCDLPLLTNRNRILSDQNLPTVAV
jgi:hypothetical protein